MVLAHTLRHIVLANKPIINFWIASLHNLLVPQGKLHTMAFLMVFVEMLFVEMLFLIFSEQ